MINQEEYVIGDDEEQMGLYRAEHERLRLRAGLFGAVSGGLFVLLLAIWESKG